MDKTETLINAKLSEAKDSQVDVKMSGNANELLFLHAVISRNLFNSLVESGIDRSRAALLLFGCVQEGTSETFQNYLEKASNH